MTKQTRGPRENSITIAAAAGTNPHKYPIGYDYKTGSLLYRDHTDEAPETLEHTYSFFGGGMGETHDLGLGGYWFGDNCYVGNPFCVRPPPTATTVTLTDNAVPADRMFEQASASGTKYLYSLAGTTVYKVRITDKTLVNTRNLGAPTVSFASGSYTGVGGTGKSITGLTFRPKAVMIKANALYYAVMKIDHSIGSPGLLWYKRIDGAFTAGTSSDGLGITADGFAAFGSANEMNKVDVQYHWWAVGGDAAHVSVDTFTGDGNDSRDISLPGFSPDALFIFTNNAADTVCFRNKTATADLTKDLSTTTAPEANIVQATAGWPADGFEVGTDNRANRLDATVCYLALLTSTDILEIGTYTGDGVDGHAITTPNFAPTFAMVYKVGAAERPCFRTDKNAGDLTSFFHNVANYADYIQTLTTTGFTTGTSVHVNENTVVYYYLVIRTDPGGDIVFGKTAEWNSIRHLPCGDAVYFQRLTTVSDGTDDDVWTATTLYADHFCVVENAIVRALGRNVSKCTATDTTVAGNWADADYDVGDPGEIITDLVASGNQCGVCTNRNYYEWDTMSVAIPVLGRRKPASTDNGKNALQWFDWTLLPYGALWRRTGGRSKKIGPDAIDSHVLTTELSSVPKNLTHYGLDCCEDWIYQAAMSADGAYWLLTGRPQGDRLKWDTLAKYASTTSVKVVFVDSIPNLWYQLGNNIAYIPLVAGAGSPDGGTWGENNATGTLYFPQTDLGKTDLKWLRVIEVESRANQTGLSWSVGVCRDAATGATVGAVFTADGLTERFWTQGTNDTCRRVRPYLTWTTSGYTPDATSPEVFRYTIRAESLPKDADIIEATLILGEDTGVTAETQLSRLKALKRAGQCKVRDIDGNIVYCTVVTIQRTELIVEEGKPPKRAVTLTLRRSDIA